MQVIKEFKKEGLATVFIGETSSGRIEFAESVQPPLKRNDKWVLLVSILYGCPIECKMCDAGGSFKGKLKSSEILAQIDYMISRYYPSRYVPSKKFKIQLSRMGEPSLNPEVLSALKKLPLMYDLPGLIPSLSTIAPRGSESFFEGLIKIKKELFDTNFQLQFSLHSTNEKERDTIIPVSKWCFAEIAEYGRKFYTPAGRKITLNFILTEESEIDADVIARYFDPDAFFIKFTPLNPTFTALEHGLKSAVDEKRSDSEPEIAKLLKKRGYDTLYSIGEIDENMIGSNCGQYIKAFEDNYWKKDQISGNGYSLIHRK